MSEIIETEVYRIGELADDARERARAWYRENCLDPDWYAFVHDDFERVCAILGVVLATRPVRLAGGGMRLKPRIWFSGFWSQGDGACFEGRYAYARGAARRIREYAPGDGELHALADKLQAVQRRHFFQLTATVAHRGRYHHKHSMDIAVEREGSWERDVSEDAREEVAEALRDLARWLYRQLEREYEHLTCEESVDEAIAVHDYTFTAAGRRFG